MIIGSKRILERDLREAMLSRQSLKDYSDNLVPPSFRHVKEIIDNQRYYVALHVRKLKGINFRHASNVAEGLIEDISLRGVTNTILDIEDLLSSVDFDYLIKGLFQKELEAYERSLKK